MMKENYTKKNKSRLKIENYIEIGEPELMATENRAEKSK